MRGVFSLLFLINLLCFFFGFFWIRPSGELELVEPSPMVSQASASSVILLNESKLASTSEEPVEKDSVNMSDSSQQSLVPEDAGRPRDTSSPKCFKLGPFGSTLDADRFHARVGLGEGAWKIDDHVESFDTTYWVYIPPAASDEESRASLRALQMMGVDSFVVSRGEFVNAVSLGTFQKRDSAEALKEQVIAMGFDVAIQEHTQSKSSVWLYLQANTANDQKLIQKNAIDSIKVSVFSCEMFAREQIFP